ncbi:MAG: MBOAT family O-acyltransferase [Imperialibacter sp.]|uniref:MBOAT family O-acyltransferase n=1 Tax=Imperialibacter sp. TaxID=2038411 RepID=UPI0032EB892B
MLFNSSGYGVFLILLLVFYYFTPKSWRWILLLASSVYFYTTWNSFFLIVVGLSILVDYICGLAIYNSKLQWQRKALFWSSIVSNIGLLFFFKYHNFFAENINTVFSALNIAILIPKNSLPFPIGISFYTFQTLSHTIDVYKGFRKPERNLGVFSLYVLFFPQILAGPIERSKNLLPQLNNLSLLSSENVTAGARLILWGLFKKMVVGDRIGELVDLVYESPETYKGLPLMIGSCLFTVQIFCDFSGYSDMAIGSARLFGVKLSKNFDNRVYFANSKANFWKGWHITLSDWFRDYLFFAVLGKGRTQVRFYVSLLFVFFITGLWHGANWGFVIWGTLNGVWIATERLTYKWRFKQFDRFGLLRFPGVFNFFCIAFIFLTTSFTAMWFKSESWEAGVKILRYSLDWGNIGKSPLTIKEVQEIGFCVAVFVLMDIINVSMKLNDFGEWVAKKSFLLRWAIYIVLVEAILNFGIVSNEFYYFKF